MVLPDSRRVSRAPRYSGTCPTKPADVSHTGLSPSLVALPSCVLLHRRFLTSRPLVKETRTGPTTPNRQRFTPVTSVRFRLLPVRSPLLGESQLMSFPPGTEMVQFPGSAFAYLWIQYAMTRSPARRVTPFGHPRISGCVLLPTAFRSLPRPSSYSSSEASTMNPFSLDHIFNLPSYRYISWPRLSQARQNHGASSPFPNVYVKDLVSWRYGDLNPRPMACKATALATELYPRDAAFCFHFRKSYIQKREEREA